MKIKYEVAYEIYINNGYKWLLANIPQQVLMLKTYHHAIKLYGPFFNRLPKNNRLHSIGVFTLYRLTFDENEEVVSCIELGYRLIMYTKNHL